VDEVKDITGFQVEVPINRKGAEILFVSPLRTISAVLIGIRFWLPPPLSRMAFDYTWSSYASEEGILASSFSGSWPSGSMPKIYSEAQAAGSQMDLGESAVTCGG